MSYVYLISSVFFMASGSVIGSLYNKKNEGKRHPTPLYVLLMSCGVFVCWAILFFLDGQVNAQVVGYSLLFALCYTACNVAMMNALKTGPVALTSLMLQLSLIGVTLWGFFFWDIDVTFTVAVGLFLVALALWLCLYTGKKEERKINVKWLFYVALLFLGNAGCSIVQKNQQMRFDGEYGNFMMFVATGISAVIALIAYLKSDKSDSRAMVKSSWYFPVATAVCNALLNLFIIFLATSELSPSLIYPVLAIGGLSVTTCFSFFILKEKMRWWQWAGVLVGAIAVGLLSI